MAKESARVIKARLERDVMRGAHRRRVARLKAIRSELAAIRSRKSALMKRVNAACKVSRERALASARERLRIETAKLRQEVREAKQAERNRCLARRVKTSLGTRVAADKLREEARRISEKEREVQAGKALEGRSKARAITLRERSEESDDEVRSNLDPGLIPIFDVVRRQIKGSPRISRTEAFLQWTEENPDEIWQMREADSARQVRALMKAEHEAYREAESTRKAALRAEKALEACGGKCGHKTKKRATRAELAEVPF